uniref:Uncharacterized protein n=1 Tax=Marseillevirus LCMAC101 TaxID=2506602 RepID=A0A481YSK3_9VIRU|nr:MAG: hypothetical protein LCMAC101_05550 [Marseillevirus LCMAC101]
MFKEKVHIISVKPVMGTKFEPYEKEYKCAHKDCDNIWTEMILEEIPILCCGGHAKVCPVCKSRGFSVYDGIGDGRFYLSQNGKEIDNYDLKTAYGLTAVTEEDIRDIF